MQRAAKRDPRRVCSSCERFRRGDLCKRGSATRSRVESGSLFRELHGPDITVGIPGASQFLVSFARLQKHDGGSEGGCETIQCGCWCRLLFFVASRGSDSLHSLCPVESENYAGHTCALSTNACLLPRTELPRTSSDCNSPLTLNPAFFSSDTVNGVRRN